MRQLRIPLYDMTEGRVGGVPEEICGERRTPKFVVIEIVGSASCLTGSISVRRVLGCTRPKDDHQHGGSISDRYAWRSEKAGECKR